MNKQRRKELQEIKDQMETLAGKIEDLKDEEAESFANMPEGLQQAQRGEESQEAQDALEAAYDAAQEAVTNLETAIGDK